MGTRTENIKAVACMSMIGGIGKDNKLLGSVPGDLANFRTLTKGKAVFMGSNTASSLPEVKPLEGRVNYVACRLHTAIYWAQKGFKPVVASTFTQALALANVDNQYEEMWVIGGGKVYSELLQYCSELYLTVAPGLPLDADAWFPVRSLREGWRVQNVETLPLGTGSITHLINDSDSLEDLMLNALQGM